MHAADAVCALPLLLDEKGGDMKRSADKALRYRGSLRRARARNVAALVLAGFLLMACANRPESIHASYVSHEKFMDLDCPALNTKMDDTRAELVKYSDMQNTKANEDAWGVFLLGIPVSKLSGDVEGEVARLKGTVEAIDTARIKKHCGSTVAGNPAPVAEAKEAAEQEAKSTADGPAKGPVAMAAPQASPRSSASGLLAVGTSWVYKFSDRIYTDNVASVTVKVLRADDQVIEERVSATMGTTRATAIRREVDARATNFDRYRLGASEEALTEFAPYLFAAGGERALRDVTNATGYPRDGVQSWTTDTAPAVWDQVTVPAGTFRAMRLEIRGRRHEASYPSTVRFTVRVWYAPEVNRYVKLENETWNFFGRVGSEVVELVKFNPPS